ncbi:tRNA pseudouridine(55) synthase TruB [Oleiagrimonas soli]|uniref:tRNA pseudouridine synthase B n=1 Tax=Oleiagrimonas soli TaxID=1543381 RepID=A0A099CWX2_9GAMM|nr:tRNA pseudouridine(55) synthase TruB [Oleiagrimonas soli]KGI78171.1 tRNA pseudouridine synthase B [Oleiagrimonas soli]MBB6183376.1 tRNA pseudouridine55 synthase [Oleiagrimonas soli]
MTAKQARRRPRRAVHGIVLLDKPLGLSSNKALQIVRGIYGAAKAGHTGSLDPLATGLLPICLGEATKIAGLLLGSRKAYEAECQLGVVTNTDDGEGEIIARHPVPTFDDAVLREHLDAFVGRIAQVPPAYSALKRDGVPMYVRARRGESVELEARDVEIHRIDLLRREHDRLQLYVECGSGTYIRSLARDLGERIGCGAHLSALRRTWVEPFREPCMWTLDALREKAEQGPEALNACLLPLDAGLAHLPRLDLDIAQSEALGHGQTVQMTSTEPGLCRAYAADGRLLALAETGPNGALQVKRGFNLPPIAE